MKWKHCSIFLLGLCINIGCSKSKQFVNEKDPQILQQINGFNLVAKEALLGNKDSEMVGYIHMLKGNAAVQYALYADPNGTIVVHSDPTLIGTLLPEGKAIALLGKTNAAEPVVQRVKGPSGVPVLEVTSPVMVGLNAPEFHGIVRIGYFQE